MYAEQRTHQKMADLAARQYGVVTRGQLTGLGYTEAMIDHAVEAGRLQAWHRSVFAVGRQGPDPHRLCMAAVLFRGDGALISHQSAIWLWGLETKLEVPVRVSHALRDEDVAETERLPVTAVPRTLLDHAAEAKRWRLERVIDKADRLGLLDLAAVSRITDEVRGHPGRGPLRRAMAIYAEKGFTRSGGERLMLAALAEAGVRRPAVNNLIEGYELDFFWGPERLAIELDSWEHHRSRRSFEEDRERRENLATAGIETLRISGTRLRLEPRKVANRVAEHLERRHRDEAA
jgi:very-short-patch-repair endonuclease